MNIALFQQFAKDESGATAVEYGILAAMIGSAVLSIVKLWGDGLENGYTALGNSFSTAANIDLTP